MGSAGAGDMLTEEQINDCRLNKSMSAEVRKALCDMALAHLEACEQEPWFKCSERLPDRDTEVLVFCGWIMSAIYQPAVKRRGNDVWYAEQAGINPVFHVTHWMPLPKPPEAK